MAVQQITSSGPILVPVDFSPYSEAALLWAAQTAQSLERTLLVLHVVHDPGSAPGSYVPLGENAHVRRIEEVAAKMLDEFVERVRSGHPELQALEGVETTLVVGLPPNRILEVAEQRGASLIVMGSQGLSGLAHLFLGSKAERVVQLSPIPVTIVKAPRVVKD